MGNFMKGVSEGKLLEAEANLLKRSGLTPEEVDIDNVVIDHNGTYTRTI
jgi:hypothetical protein